MYGLVYHIHDKFFGGVITKGLTDTVKRKGGRYTLSRSVRSRNRREPYNHKKIESVRVFTYRHTVTPKLNVTGSPITTTC